MSVKTQHKDYMKFMPKWVRCRDVVCGQDAIHAAGEKYLSKLKDQKPKDYSAYKNRALFYNASARTLTGLVGMLFRKPPKIETGAGFDEYLQDIDANGTPFSNFSKDIVDEVMEVGRVGVMVDFPPSVAIDGVITVAKAQRLGLRPYLKNYRTESIINWKTARINNRTVLSLVVLVELFVTPKNEFEDACEDRYRVLDLDPTQGGIYRQRVFRIDDKGQDELVSEHIPLMNGAPLDYIPFYVITPDGVELEIDEPPLLDLVDVNLSHYRTSADYEHACHFTGLPTPVVTGYSPPQPKDGKEPDKLYIGSHSAWVFTDPQAKASYLEFTGQGIQALVENLDRKEQQMAILGARMIAAEKKAAETATTAAIHRTGENSVLSSIAIAVSLGLTKALNTLGQWANIAGTVVYEINREFAPYVIDAQLLTALVKAVQAGLMSEESLFDLLQRADIQDPELIYEEEKKRIEANPPLQQDPAQQPNLNQPPKKAQAA